MAQDNIEAAQKPLCIALIGAGMVARTHLSAVLGAGEKVALSGLLARNPENAARLLETIPNDQLQRPKVYQDFDALLADEKVEAVVILTPPNVREEIITPLAKAGKHILLEKPVARNLVESENVVAVCEDAGIELGIVFQHRFRAASIDAKRLIASGELGKLGVVEVSVPWWRGQSYYDEPGRGSYERDGGGVLISQAIHSIDLMLSLTGPASRVQAMTATSIFHQMESEDFATAGLQFANGAIGSLTASTCSFPGGPEVINLHFENASLRLDAGTLQINWRDGRSETRGAETSSGGGADPMAFGHSWHQSVLEDFASAIRAGKSPLITGRAALAAHQLIDAIERSASEGRSVEVTQ